MFEPAAAASARRATRADAASPTHEQDIAATAAHWWQVLCAEPGCHRMGDLPAHAAGALAQLCSHALDEGKTLLLLVPDDEFLPALSTALDIAVRPLCLVLPCADFAARIAMRATLSLLKSRLARQAEDDHAHAWQHLRTTLERKATLWQQAQAWTASNERGEWPAATPQLFPVRILPLAAARAQPVQQADIIIAFCCDPGPDLILLGRRALLLGAAMPGGETRLPAQADETTRLQQELAQLSQDVAELELELITAQSEMSEFTTRYYAQVGRRMTELDALRAKLARVRRDALRADAANAAERDAGAAPDNTRAGRAQTDYASARAQAERSRAESTRFEQARQHHDTPAADTPFKPDAALKRLFRQIAQRIHPDRAENEQDRAWRTQLMSEANRAYRAGDSRALHEIASLWDEGSQLPQPSAGISLQTLLRSQIAALRARFEAIREELHRLFGSRLYELFLAARQIRRSGRDLLSEMADKLDTQIAEVLRALREQARPA